jgi:hypothetical protein
MYKRIHLIVSLVLLLLLAGCLPTPSAGTTIAPSSELLYSKMDVYYPIGETHRIKYDTRVRPFDTDVTLEGLGWQNGKLVAVLRAQVNTQKRTYSHFSKLLSPRVTYQGESFPLSRLVWEEGAGENYDGSVYRYAVSADGDHSIPEGALPDSLTIHEAAYKLPATLPPVAALPAKQQLSARVGTVPKVIDSTQLTYQVTGVRIEGNQRVLHLLVHAGEECNETSRFLLRDDQGRIYTFDPSSLPRSYQPGNNEVELNILQPIPADCRHLSFVMFESELQQPGLYNVLAEAEIPLF